MSRTNPIPVVPGDTWDFELPTLNEDGSEADLSSFTVLSAIVTGSRLSFDVDVELFAGYLQVTASPETTIALRLGNVSVLTVRIQAPSGAITTIVSDNLNGVTTLSNMGASVRIVGVQGARGPGTFYGDGEPDADFGINLDTYIDELTRLEYRKIAGEWGATGNTIPTGETVAPLIEGSVKLLGAEGDNDNDDSAVFIKAIEDYDVVRIPFTPNGYKVSQQLTPRAGQTIIFDPGAKIMGYGNPGHLIVPESGVKFVNLNVDVSNMTGSDEIVYLDDVERVIIDGLTIQGGPVGRSAVTLNNARYCQVKGPCEIIDVITTNIRLTGADCYENTVGGIRFKGTTVGLMIVLAEGAHRNRIHDCDNEGTSAGDELVGVTWNSYENIISNCYAYNTWDAGYSITGSRNLVIGCMAKSCRFNGFAIFGSDNLIVGCSAWDNGRDTPASGFAGFSVASDYGGIAKNNRIVGCYGGDTQTVKTQGYLAKVGGTYGLWATGVAVETGDYKYYGQNLYYAASSGTTGVTAPVHTSGDVSDGAVTWRYVQSSTSFLSTNNDIEVYGTTWAIAAYSDTALADNRSSVGFERVATKIAANIPEWQAGEAVVYGTLRKSTLPTRVRFYSAATNGTTGSTAPSHGSGGESDGAVTWRYVGVRELQLLFPTDRGLAVQDVIEIRPGTSTARGIWALSQTPSGLVSDRPGAMALRTDGSPFPIYGKESGVDTTDGWLPAAMLRTGNSTERPTGLTTSHRGIEYYDTTLGKPIWWTGTAWADDVQWITSNITDWATGVAVTYGTLRKVSNRFYIAITAGTTGATAPTHTTGTASDGAVTWRYKSTDSLLQIFGSDRGITVADVLRIQSGTGTPRGIWGVSQSPSGLVTENPGALAQRMDAGSVFPLYAKESGVNTTDGWLPVGLIRNGNTAGRPASLTTSHRGLTYWDTTLGKPIWWDGANWKDATGATV